jgi:hypothetical protein
VDHLHKKKVIHDYQAPERKEQCHLKELTLLKSFSNFDCTLFKLKPVDFSHFFSLCIVRYTQTKDIKNCTKNTLRIHWVHNTPASRREEGSPEQASGWKGVFCVPGLSKLRHKLILCPLFLLVKNRDK